MSNIEEMEKQIKQFGVSINNHEGWRLSGILENILNSLKDLHEENCKLWKALAEMGYKEYTKEKFIPDKDDWKYPYEPNE